MILQSLENPLHRYRLRWRPVWLWLEVQVSKRYKLMYILYYGSTYLVALASLGNALNVLSVVCYQLVYVTRLPQLVFELRDSLVKLGDECAHLCLGSKTLELRHLLLDIDLGHGKGTIE